MEQDNARAIEAIKKDLRSIRQTGAIAKTLGWILLLLASVVIWMASSKTIVFIIFGIFALAGFFFIYTGKYIKEGLGGKVKSLLLANGILALLFFWAIFPIYVSIRSFKGRSRFKRLPEKIQDLYCRHKRFRPGWLGVVLIIVLMAIGAASIYFKTKDIDQKALDKKNASTVQAAPVVDTVAKSGFTIDFPSSVSATDFTKKVSGKDVSYTTYLSTANNSTENFSVYAYNFPASFNYSTISKSALATVIHQSLSNIVTDLHGTIVTSSKSTYLDYPSEDAVFTCKTLGGTTTGYMRVFYVGDHGYSVFSVGSSQADFNTFANSFQVKAT